MNMTKNTNNIILLKALYDHNLQFVDKLLINKSVTDNLYYANIKGENALLLCLHFEYRIMALKILDYENIGLEQIDHSLNNTLIMAIKKQYEDIALKILNKGFKDINYVDTYGDTALTLILIDLAILVNQRLAGVRRCELDQLRFLLLLARDKAIAKRSVGISR